MQSNGIRYPASLRYLPTPACYPPKSNTRNHLSSAICTRKAMLRLRYLSPLSAMPTRYATSTRLPATPTLYATSLAPTTAMRLSATRLSATPCTLAPMHHY
eukprot:2772269-Rhodomonas_salina.1